MVVSMLVKKRIYPRPHDTKNHFQLSEATPAQQATSIQVITNDEGQGDPSAYNAHPEHASFAEKLGSHCFPDSTISRMFCEFQMALSKGCVETDKIELMKVMIVPFFLSFKENYEAIDELSTNDVSEILEMTKEATDRQGTPIYNGTKLTGDALVQNSEYIGLTTDTKMEGITFDIDQLYDALQYYTNAGKLAASIGKIRWLTITRRKLSTYRMNFVVSKVKKINPYTACGIIIMIPKATTGYQIFMEADTTAIPHLNIMYRCRFLEWNENYDMTKT